MSNRRETLTRMSALLACALPLGAALAQSKPADKAPAIDGYDPVAYFTEKQPAQGKPNISYDWDDKRYLFANAKHRDLFAANPDKYEPQFNGLCSGNVSVGKKVKADPTIWRVVDGKLYLFAGQQHNEEAVAKKVVLAQSKWKDLK